MSLPALPIRISAPACPLSLLLAELPLTISSPPPALIFSIELKTSLPSTVCWAVVRERLIRLFLEPKIAVSIPAPPIN